MTRYERCPKCGHAPLPADQALPAACAACGVVFAKVAAAALAPAQGSVAQRVAGAGAPGVPAPASRREAIAARLLHVPQRVDRWRFGGRVALFAALTVWGVLLIGADHHTGAIGESFLHGPLLIFHEAGHVLFSPFGQWLTVLGGTFGQLLMPAVIVAAFLVRNHDPYGASVGLWLFGVSLLDVAPYVYDALDPKLVLLSGSIGEGGGHDWIFLLGSSGLLRWAPQLGGAARLLGALVMLAALTWSAALLIRQRVRLSGNRLHEE